MAVFRRQKFVTTQRPVGPVVIAATYLPLARWRYLLSFLRMSSRVQGQLEHSPGVAWFAVQAEYRRKRFWTVSVWTDQPAMTVFVRTEPHATAMKRFSIRGSPSAAFAVWEGTDPHVAWEEVYRRLGQTPPAGRVVTSPLRLPPGREPTNANTDAPLPPK